MILCGYKDHECNEEAVVYEKSTGERFYFKDKVVEREWYEKNWESIVMGSVACSICGSAAFDNRYKIEI